MTASSENISVHVLTDSNVRLTGHTDSTWKEKSKSALKQIKYLFKETTVEPCLFIYQFCIALSSLTVQNMHLEKSCRVNLNFSNAICDRIRDRNTTGLEDELNQVQSLVAKVVAWKFPLQTAIPAVMILFVGAWSDKYRRRKFCILMPMIGEICVNIGLLLATYYFYELSLISTALIEALPAALSGSYIFVFMGMYSFMSDKTTIKNRTFRLGIVSIFVNIGTPLGTAMSGVLLRLLGYYGMFLLLLVLHSVSFTYGLFRLEDFNPVREEPRGETWLNQLKNTLCEIFGLVGKTVLVLLKARVSGGRTQIFAVLALYFIMVGPLYGDSQVGYLYAIRKFSFTEVEYSLYGTLNVVLGMIAKLYALIGVTEALAPSIYMPTSSYIYVSTIDWFPGAFYLFDAALTFLALGLFAFVYILVRRRLRNCVAASCKKDEFARSNEVSRF